MGFFSWKTAEGQSIANAYSSRPTFTVWMVMPDGTKYEEDRYGGDGIFGGKDFYEAVAELNGYAGSSDEEDMRGYGIGLFFGDAAGERKGVMTPRLTSDPNKKWEDLTDPEHCPDQGYFYDD